MIVYLEGVDGSGKTTLAKEIYKYALRLQTIKGYTIEPQAESMISTNPNKPLRWSGEKLIAKLNEWANDTTKLYIMDRGPISDIVYRIFDDHQTACCLDDLRGVFCKPNMSEIIYCDSKDSETLMKERGDDNPIAIQRHKELRKAYSIIMTLFPGTRYSIGGSVRGTCDYVFQKLFMARSAFIKRRAKK